jgi:hypothetical protein
MIGMPGGQMSGSAGAITASHNRFGPYFRNRSIPVNPRSTRQNAIRNIMGSLTQRWSQTLTSTQRSQWDVYAAAITWKNKLGQDVTLTGFNHYIRSNTARMQAGLAVVDDGPATLVLPEGDPVFAATASEATQKLSITFDDTAAWVDSAGAAMLLSVGAPQLNTRNFFNGPFRFADSIDGAAISPETSPFDLSSPFVFQSTQKLWVSGRIALADGRLSQPFRCDCTSVA